MIFLCSFSKHSLHPSFSLCPEKDGINPKGKGPGRGAEESVGVRVTHFTGILCIYSCKTHSAFCLVSLSSFCLVHLSFCWGGGGGFYFLQQTHFSFEALHLYFIDAGRLLL